MYLILANSRVLILELRHPISHLGSLAFVFMKRVLQLPYSSRGIFRHGDCFCSRTVTGHNFLYERSHAMMKFQLRWGLLAIGLLFAFGSVQASAQSTRQDMNQDKKEIKNENADINQDKRDITQDKKDI